MGNQGLGRMIWEELSIHPFLLMILVGGGIIVEHRYPVLGQFLYYILPVVGLGLGVLSIVHLVECFPALVRINVVQSVIPQLERWATLPVMLFIGHSLLVLGNAASDFSTPTARQFTIKSKPTFDIGHERRIAVGFGEMVDAMAPTTADYVLLSSWPDLWGGEVVRANVHPGNLGFPWISKIERDEEHYLRTAVQRAPRSAVIWRNLVIFYMNEKRYEEAAAALYDYLNIYPFDYYFVADIAGQLVSVSLLDEAIPLLEYTVGIGKQYDHYQLLGIAYQWKGDKAKAVEVFQKSIPLAPHDWEVYFHLGETLGQMGRVSEALDMYRKVLERRPEFPELDHLITNLKRQPKA